MAGYTRSSVIFNGEAGKVFTNTTERVLYQFFCNWANTCGVCAQYDHAIGPNWPLPIHHGCNCRQQNVLPGAQAEPWVDYRAILDSLPEDQQKAAVGASNWKLIESGTVQWKDVVTEYRVRDLREVVAIRKLDVSTLTKAGLNPRIAQEAYASVHTAEHELIETKRKQLVADLRGAGLSDAQIKQLAATGLGSRVSIVAGPSRGSVLPGAATPIEDRLRNLLAGWQPPPLPPPIVPPKPKPKPAPTPPAREPQPTGDRFSEAYTGIEGADSETTQRLQSVLEAIDQVHGVPPLASIPIKVNGQLEGNNGKFVMTPGATGNFPAAVQIWAGGDHVELTLAHESGHFLEGFGIPGHDRGERNWDRAEQGPLKDWMAAIEKSQAFHGLAAMEASGKTGDGGKLLPQSKDQLNYLLQWDELWARSYAQYIATRSRHPALLDQLQAQRDPAQSPIFHQKQWQDADFAPIAQALDDLFRNLKWTK